MGFTFENLKGVVNFLLLVVFKKNLRNICEKSLDGVSRCYSILNALAAEFIEFIHSMSSLHQVRWEYNAIF